MNALLVPIDGSECSLHALDVATDLATRLGLDIELCHIVDLGKAAAMSGAEPLLLSGCYEELQSEGALIIDDATKRVGGKVRVSSHSATGAPIARIIQLEDELKPFMVVIGSHGRSGIKRLLIGSVAEGVSRGSSVPVLIVPAPHRAQAASARSPRTAPYRVSARQ